MRVKAIQFIGTQRSGSNLLRLMLGAHSQISAPHPPHLLKTFYPLLTYYGDLSVRENLADLINDMSDWVEANPVPWEGVNLDRNQILDTSRNIIDVFRSIYEARMKFDRAAIWCCKSTFNINYIQEIEPTIKPFYVYLFRDGRDVASSFKKAIVGPKHAYHLALKWSEEQKVAATFLATIPEERYICLAYEDIIEKPEICLRRLCECLGVAYEPQMLHFYESNESRRTADSGEMWKNVLNPVMKDNAGKYQHELSVDEIALFESIAGNELELLGYQRQSKDGTAFETDIANYDQENKSLQKHAQLTASIADKEKRNPQKELLHKIHLRLGLTETATSTV